MHGGHLVVAPATNIMTITDITDREAALQRENERLLNTIRVQAAAIEELRSAHDVALQGWKCECSTDDACRFAKERDAFKADAERRILEAHSAKEYADSVITYNVARITRLRKFLADLEKTV